MLTFRDLMLLRGAIPYLRRQRPQSPAPRRNPRDTPGPAPRDRRSPKRRLR